MLTKARENKKRIQDGSRRTLKWAPGWTELIRVLALPLINSGGSGLAPYLPPSAFSSLSSIDIIMPPEWDWGIL